MAKKLAENAKYNICIVGRNEQKMKEKLQEIKDASMKNGQTEIETKYIIADFQKLLTCQEYETVVADPLKDLDIGILIVNAGMMTAGFVEQLSLAEVQTMVSVNVCHVAYTTKVFVQKMVERFKTTGLKSGLIITSSAGALAPMPGATVYSASKAFDHFVACGLHEELKGMVDVISYTACGVKSNLNRSDAAKELAKDYPGQITTEQAAEVCFRDLGHEKVTFGALIHKGIFEFSNLFPQSMVYGHISCLMK